MHDPIEVKTAVQCERFCAVAGWDPLSPDVLSRQAPDASLFVPGDSNEAAARCSLWWSHVPTFPEHRLGLIGHYGARNVAAAGQLLGAACERLAAQGCSLAAGPMDGNTWNRYRLLSERGGEPLFFLEPDNPDDWPGHFLANGFSVLASYTSALSPSLDVDEARAAEYAQRASKRGILIRSLRMDQFEQELRRIHALSLASFQRNFLYTPIGEDEFVSQYRAVRPYVRPELVLLAELAGEPIGYVFTIPDLLQAKRGLPVNTVIVKTLAVHPDHGGIGLGSLLVARCHQAAQSLGYARSIHALMHETNRSQRISGHTSTPIRRYELYARPLRAES